MFDGQPRDTPSPRPRWRNYYRVYRILNLAPRGPIFPGIIASPFSFASKDDAEAHARAFLGAVNPPHFTKAGRCLMDHAGTFPEGDAAN